MHSSYCAWAGTPIICAFPGPNGIVHRRNLEDAEKDYLRGQLLQLILEEDSQVSEAGHMSSKRHAHVYVMVGNLCLLLDLGKIDSVSYRLSANPFLQVLSLRLV